MLFEFNAKAKHAVDFWWRMFCRFSQEQSFKFVTENFTTIFTARKWICHLELTLGGFSRKRCRLNHFVLIATEKVRERVASLLAEILHSAS